MKHWVRSLSLLSRYVTETNQDQPVTQNKQNTRVQPSPVPIPLSMIQPTAHNRFFTSSPPHGKLDSIFNETYIELISGSTKDYQLLESVPKDIAVMVAFLRLLGVQAVSLSHLSHNFRTHISFINRSITIPIDSAPIFITSSNQVLNFFYEFSLPPNKITIPSRSITVKYPLEHAKPNIEKEIETELANGSVILFYTEVASLSDDQILPLIHRFIPITSPVQEAQLIERIKTIRPLCADYVMAQASSAPKAP